MQAVIMQKTNEALWLDGDWVINVRDRNLYRLLYICASLSRCLRCINGWLLKLWGLENSLIFKMKITKYIRNTKKKIKIKKVINTLRKGKGYVVHCLWISSANRSALLSLTALPSPFHFSVTWKACLRPLHWFPFLWLIAIWLQSSPFKLTHQGLKWPLSG